MIISLLFIGIIVVVYLVFAGYCMFNSYGINEEED